MSSDGDAGDEMAGFLSDMESSSDDDMQWPAAAAPGLQEEPAATLAVAADKQWPAAAPGLLQKEEPAATPLAVAADACSTGVRQAQQQQEEDGQQNVKAEECQAFAASEPVLAAAPAWAPPALRPVQDATLSCADESDRPVVGALAGLRTGTDWPACAAAWCPQPQTLSIDEPAGLVLAVGTYRLEETDPSSSSLEPQPEPEPEPAQPSVYEQRSGGHGGSGGTAGGAGGLRDTDPELRERQRRQQQRNGTIRLYQLSVDPSVHVATDEPTGTHAQENVGHPKEEVRHWRPVSTQQEQSITRLAAGALDIKWCPWLLRYPGLQTSQRTETSTDRTSEADVRGAHASSPLLGVACADGSIRLLQLHEDASGDKSEQGQLSALRSQRAHEAKAATADDTRDILPSGTGAMVPASKASMQLKECAVGYVLLRLRG
jgi:hypothetical protein